MKYSIGIDISKSTFDVCVFNGEKEIFEKKFNYSTNGIKAFIKVASNYSNCVIAMEATGNYCTKLAVALYEKDFYVCVINPAIIKNYIRMKMSRVKTDKADAKYIARYAYSETHRKYKPDSELQKNIKVNTETIKSLIKTRTIYKNRLHALNNEVYPLNTAKEITIELIKKLDKEIKKLERINNELIKKTYGVKYEKAQKIPGIGDRTLSVVFGYLFAFDNFENAKQVSAYIGINPSPCQSGSSLNTRGSISKKGHKYLRSTFYMAAISASRYNKQCMVFYQRLLAKGKPKKAAIVAVANKLIKQVFAIVKNERDYQEDYNLLKKL